MNGWIEFYERVMRHVRNLDTAGIWYRGHGHGGWQLLPGLARVEDDAFTQFRESEPNTLEKNFYFDFVMSAGDLIPRSNSSWDNLFLMQHHGMPTRLLDWTESFGVAVFFALAYGFHRPAIWVLDPYELNHRTLGPPDIIDACDFGAGYDDYFLHRTAQFPGDVVALRPIRQARRISQQLSAFTLHRELHTALDSLHPTVVRKFPIPARAIDGALEFLRVNGISDYTLFPDLDGLARDLKRRYLVSA